MIYPFRTALVTGASAGIGRSIAELLGAAGIPTVIVARRGDRLDELAARFPSLHPLVADLLSTEGQQTVISRLSDADHPIDLLVNNAGFGVSGNVADVDPDRIHDMIGLNISALTMLTRAALPQMLGRRRGWIMQVSSVAGFQPGPGAAVYSATKAYVTSFTEALSVELRDTGVLVSALCPGFTRTEFHEVSGSADDASRIPDIAWLSSADVAAAGLNAVAVGKVLEVPGAGYKAITAVSTVLPHGVMRGVLGGLDRLSRDRLSRRSR